MTEHQLPATCEVVYLAIQNISKKWTMPIKDWKPALNRFAVTQCCEAVSPMAIAFHCDLFTLGTIYLTYP